jgi:hypothetical protein
MRKLKFLLKIFFNFFAMLTVTTKEIFEVTPKKEEWVKIKRSLNFGRPGSSKVCLTEVLEQSGIVMALLCFKAFQGMTKEKREYPIWCARQIWHLLPDRLWSINQSSSVNFEGIKLKDYRSWDSEFSNISEEEFSRLSRDRQIQLGFNSRRRRTKALYPELHLDLEGNLVFLHSGWKSQENINFLKQLSELSLAENVWMFPKFDGLGLPSITETSLDQVFEGYPLEAQSLVHLLPATQHWRNINDSTISVVEVTQKISGYNPTYIELQTQKLKSIFNVD